MPPENRHLKWTKVARVIEALAAIPGCWTASSLLRTRGRTRYQILNHMLSYVMEAQS